MLPALSRLGRESSRRRACRRPRSQAGVSLIEVLVAVGLAGSVIVALAAGILAMLRSSEVTSSQQRLQAALSSSTESVKSLPYLACTAGAAATAAGQAASPTAYDTAYAAWPGRWQPSTSAGVGSVRVTGVEYWTPAATNAALGSFLPACPAAAAGGDRGAQRLTVRVVMADGAAKDAQVVLRRTS